MTDSDSWHRDRARQIILRQLNDRVKFLKARNLSPTGRFASSQPEQQSLPKPTAKISEYLDRAIQRALSAHQTIGDILADNKDALRTEELDAVLVDIRRQRAHFAKLGKDKPADHEYNLTAEGYQRIIQEWGPLHSYLLVRMKK